MCASAMEKYLGVSVIMGVVGLRKLYRIFPGSSDFVAIMWACGRLPEFISDVFFYFIAAMGGVKSSN